MFATLSRMAIHGFIPPADIMKKQVNVIRDYMKANPINSTETAPYTVYVDDNYHHMDQTYRYKLGGFLRLSVRACSLPEDR